MSSYNIYVSDKNDQELVDVFNKMKAEGTLSEFIVESCQANLPFFLDRMIADADTARKHYEELKKHFSSAKENIKKAKNTKRREYLTQIPNNGKTDLMAWLTSPRSISDWKAAGFKSAQEVIEELKELEEMIT